MKILVTAGATREPVDAVRFLSNVSTGTTGATLADLLARRGHEVVLLRGEGSATPREVSVTEIFSSAADLRARLERQLGTGEFAAVIMAAAVADYRPAEVAQGKISSAISGLTLQLVPNEKILPRLKSFAPRPLRVIGFKLTVDADAAARREAVAAQFSAGGVDAVVHNDLTEVRASANHPFWLWRSVSLAPVRHEGMPALAVALADVLSSSSP